MDISGAGPSSTTSARIEMVALDLDGTLLRSDKGVSRRVADSVAEVSRLGIPVVLASARPPRSVQKIYGQLRLDTPAISCNGALVLDPPRGRYVLHRPVPAALCRQILWVARRMDPEVSVVVEIMDRWFTDRIDERPRDEDRLPSCPDFIATFDAVAIDAVTRMQLQAPPDRIARIGDELRRRFEGRVSIHRGEGGVLQAIRPGVDKGAALAHVAGSLGIERDNVMAIGDAPNDMGMLRFAGLGVAVDNARRPVRNAADAIVPSNDEDGVAYALHHFILASV